MFSECLFRSKRSTMRSTDGDFGVFLARSLHRASAPRPQGLNAMNSRRDFGNLLGAMQMEDVRRSSAQCIAAASMAVSPRAEL